QASRRGKIISAAMISLLQHPDQSMRHPPRTDHDSRSPNVQTPNVQARVQVHPARNWFRKHMKSSTFRTGSMVQPSQLARESPALNPFRKHAKSSALSTGGVVEPSQLA